MQPARSEPCDRGRERHHREHEGHDQRLGRERLTAEKVHHHGEQRSKAVGDRKRGGDLFVFVFFASFVSSWLQRLADEAYDIRDASHALDVVILVQTLRIEEHRPDTSAARADDVDVIQVADVNG
jgi:hypothetical protein